MPAVSVLVIGVGHVPASMVASGRGDLPGPATDVRGWLQRLTAMGVDRDSIIALCTLPGGRVPDWADGGTGRAAVHAALTAWTRRLAGSPRSHGLLLVSGHGQDGAIVCSDGTIALADIARVLDEQVPGRGITAILDLCRTSRAAHGLRDVDLVIHSADGGDPAEEHRDGDRWQGAFTWAAHRVIDRWMTVGPHGARVPISPAVLVTQASRVLDGLGYAQRPAIVGPEALRHRGLLGGSRIQPAPLAAGITREIDAGYTGDFRVYDIRKMDGTRLGILVVTDAQWNPAPGWAAGREYWSTAIPSGDFKLTVANNQTLPATVPTLAYQHISFAGAPTGTHTVQTPGWAIKSGGAIVGYLHRAFDHLDWFMTTSPITATYPSGTLVFSQLGTSKTVNNAAYVSAAKI